MKPSGRTIQRCAGLVADRDHEMGARMRAGDVDTQAREHVADRTLHTEEPELVRRLAGKIDAVHFAVVELQGRAGRLVGNARHVEAHAGNLVDDETARLPRVRRRRQYDVEYRENCSRNDWLPHE